MKTACLLGLLLMGAGLQGAVISTLPNLTEIRVTELSGGSNTFVFTPGGAPINNRINTPMGLGTNDFVGVPAQEFYDVFYSNANGTPNTLGEFITVEVEFPFSGAALNIDAIALRFSAGPDVIADILAGFSTGPSYVAASELKAIDGLNGMASQLGSTSETRLRLTLGFSQLDGSPTPEPSSMILSALGVLGAAAFKLRQRRS